MEKDDITKKVMNNMSKFEIKIYFFLPKNDSG